MSKLIQNTKLFEYSESNEIEEIEDIEQEIKSGPNDLSDAPPEIWSVMGIWNDITEVERRKPKVRDYISFGNIGKNDYWSRYMKMKGVPESNPIEGRVIRIFQAGDTFHDLVKGVFKSAGVYIFSQDDLNEKGERDWSEIPATKTQLKQFGAFDVLVGGKPDLEKAMKWIEKSDMTQFQRDKATKIAEYFSDKFPNGLKPMIYEIKSINCIAKGELIYTENGLKKIEDIKKGENIYSIKDDFSLVKNKVKNVFKSGRKEVYKFTTKTGKTILATDKHKFLTTNVKYLADRNILPKNVIWKELRDIKEGNKIAVVNKYPENKLKEKINKDVALVLGYLVGDGYINKKYQSNIAVVKMNEAILIKDIIDRNFDLDCQIKQYKSLSGILRVNLTGGIKNRKGCGNFSNKFLNFLKKNNINKIKTDKEIPKVILDSNNEVIAMFLRGLFQADGCVAKHENGIQINYGTISKKLAKQVSHCLLRLGIQSSLYEVNHRKGGFRSKNSIFYNINIRSFSFRKFAKTVGFVDFKNKKLNKLLKGWKPNSKNRKENIFFDIVKSIEKIGIKETYDIEVESKDKVMNSFCCEDIIVHNSMAFWGKKNYLHEAYPHHRHQLFGYLKANHKNPEMLKRVEEAGIKVNSIDEGRLLYISKDDLVMAEFPISIYNKSLEESYKNDIDTMSGYILRDEEPPKPPYVIFNKRKTLGFQKNKIKYKVRGCYVVNWEVTWSSYFTLMTGFKSDKVKDFEQTLKAEIKEKNEIIKAQVLAKVDVITK